MELLSDSVGLPQTSISTDSMQQSNSSQAYHVQEHVPMSPAATGELQTHMHRHKSHACMPLNRASDCLHINQTSHASCCQILVFEPGHVSVNSCVAGMLAAVAIFVAAIMCWSALCRVIRESVKSLSLLKVSIFYWCLIHHTFVVSCAMNQMCKMPLPKLL